MRIGLLISIFVSCQLLLMIEEPQFFSDINDPQIPDAIELGDPVCYAYNKMQGTSNVGSFTVEQKANRFYAISCFHVYASRRDFLGFLSDPNYQLRDRTVVFRIGNKTFEADIISHQWGNYNGKGKDFAVCEVDQEMYNDFLRTINLEWLTSAQLQRMRMFGAYSKFNVGFHRQLNATNALFHINGVQRQLHVFKIYPVNRNVQKGDSGSLVYFKVTQNGPLHRGIVIAKNNDAAFMARLT